MGGAPSSSTRARPAAAAPVSRSAISSTSTDCRIGRTCTVAAAVEALFPSEVAREITQGDAFGALTYRLSQYRDDTGTGPAQALEQLDSDDREFAARANNPAAFLARKVSEL